MTKTDLVTGAFGFTGSRIAERLLADGRTVRTLSRRRNVDHRLAGRIDQMPYDFAPAALGETLAGVDTVYVTLWMRFPRGSSTWPRMVAQVQALADVAAEVGVRRVVYMSVCNAAHDASTAYFRAKAEAEDAVRGAGISYAIVRPTLLFGEHDILINNMAWTLRRFPMFGVPGNGRYRVNPVYVGDIAELCIRLAESADPIELDASGPETYAFDDLVRSVARAVGTKRWLVHSPPLLVLAATKIIGVAVRDVILTRDEIRELMQEYLVSAEPPNCPTRLTDWLAANASEVGRRYSSELGRNFRL